MRDSWVKSGYGTYDGTNFKFGKKYVYNTSGSLATYQGNISEVTYYTEEVDDKEEVHFNFGKVTADNKNVDYFKGILGEYLGGITVDMDTAVQAKNADGAEYKTLNAEGRKAVTNNFEDIKFAFSTDTGNFNKYLGYLYSPLTAADSYVPEFVTACQTAVAGGAGSVVMFMSESYGLHVLMCTETANDYGMYDSQEAFEEDRKVKGSVAYNFEKANIDLIESTYVSKAANTIIKSYIPEDGKDNNYVKHFNKVYKDLITE